MQNVGVLVIGAGPYGLSISAHLRALQVDHLVVGAPMDSYRIYSPAGMRMKSEPYASAFASPQPGYDVRAYSQAHGIEYVDRVTPLSVEQFLDYADWYTAQLVPDVRDDRVIKLTKTDGGFQADFAGSESVIANQVVIATGLGPHKYVPGELSGVPAELISHTTDRLELDRFGGRKVAVIGSGQSALETAALLNERGAEVRIVARGPKLEWNVPNPDHVSLLGQIRWPVAQLCEGWYCKFYDTPWAFRLLSPEKRVEKARTVLGPSGAWWLKERVDGVIEALTGYSVQKADASGDGVRLFLDGPKETVLDVDHVMAGTGFRMDLSHFSFLPSDIRSEISVFENYPVVSKVGESSVRNLYFAGAPAAANIGPSMRFIAGTHNQARPLAKKLASRARAAK
jgi:cation diffusion facilitator CzcD-associated flavoprotein CzcO